MFTYKCGALWWTSPYTYNAAIGYSAAGGYYENHQYSLRSNVNEIACLNSPYSVWFNVVYKLSGGTPGLTLPPPLATEPGKKAVVYIIITIDMI